MGEEKRAHHLRPASARKISAPIQQDIARAAQCVRPALRHDARQCSGHLVDRRQRVDIGRGALQHGDVLDAVRHRRNQGGRSCAATDHHDLLALIVQVLWPVLRVNQGAFEVLLAWEVGEKTIVVVVITGAAHKVFATVVSGFAARLMQRCQVPQPLLAGPVCTGNLDPVLNLIGYAIFRSGVLDIFTDLRTIGQHLALVPRAELVAEAEHVRIGAYSWIAKQIPCSTDAVTALQDRQGFPWKLLRKMAGSTNARQARANDQYVVMLVAHMNLRAYWSKQGS
ncbi:hypothetical protein D3C85_694700 [compost metagenome]